MHNWRLSIAIERTKTGDRNMRWNNGELMEALFFLGGGGVSSNNTLLYWGINLSVFSLLFSLKSSYKCWWDNSNISATARKQKLNGEAASLRRGITKMPLIFASFFLVTILKRMWVPICPKQAVPFHIPQPLQLKKKNPKHLSVLIIPSFPARPAFIPSVQSWIFDVLVIFFPFCDVLAGGSVHLIKMYIFKSESGLAGEQLPAGNYSQTDREEIWKSQVSDTVKQVQPRRWMQQSYSSSFPAACLRPSWQTSGTRKALQLRNDTSLRRVKWRHSVGPRQRWLQLRLARLQRSINSHWLVGQIPPDRIVIDVETQHRTHAGRLKPSPSASADTPKR